MNVRSVCAVGVLWLSVVIPAQGAVPADPLQSPMWGWLARQILTDGEIVFDERVRVDAPDNAEDNFQVPIAVRVDGLTDVTEILLFVDLNPIIRAARFLPVKAKPFFALRIKMNQGSAVRAAARTADGVWHVGGKFVDAAGGGCAAPSAASLSGSNWEDNLNRVQARMWSREDGSDRIRLRLIHPMDTGLVENIPAFFVERLTLKDKDGEVLAHMEIFAPVSEDPVLTLEVEDRFAGGGGYRIVGRDNNGNEIDAWLKGSPGR